MNQHDAPGVLIRFGVLMELISNEPNQTRAYTVRRSLAVLRFERRRSDSSRVILPLPCPGQVRISRPDVRLPITVWPLWSRVRHDLMYVKRKLMRSTRAFPISIFDASHARTSIATSRPSTPSLPIQRASNAWLLPW
jgi:hypothetical protein